MEYIAPKTIVLKKVPSPIMILFSSIKSKNTSTFRRQLQNVESITVKRSKDFEELPF